MKSEVWTLATSVVEKERILKDYVYYDNGLQEVLISRADITKAIVATEIFEIAKIFTISASNNIESIVTTLGFYIDKCDPDWRRENIEQLIRYQTDRDDIGKIYYLPADSLNK